MALLRVQNLQKSFRDPDGEVRRVIDIESFELERQQVLALRGESGCGKTTFLHLISGIHAADAGLVEIAGERMTGASEAARDQLRARRLGYVFQTFNLLQGFTVLENLMLGMAFAGSVDRARAESLLERVSLDHRRHHYPRQLSSGQQQRVAVARALVNRPQLVLADEPTGNLDPTNALAALKLIRDICLENEAALLLVSHDEAVLNNFENHRDFAEINREAQPVGEAAA